MTASRISQFSQSSFQQNEKDPIPQADKAVGERVHSNQEPGIKQDHHYKRTEENNPIDTHKDRGIEVQQAKAQRHPLPDGTIPPSTSPIGQDGGDPESDPRRAQVGQTQHPLDHDPNAEIHPTESKQSSIPTPTHEPLSPREARIAQRQSEDPIPATAADPPGGEEEFSIEQEKDVYYQPPGQTHPVLSALPRVRVPKIENDIQGGDSHIPKDINADVYYSGVQEEASIEPTEEQLAQLFHTPRAARVLGKKTKYMPGGKRAYHTTPTRAQRSTEAEKQDLQRLAQDMAKDIQENDVSLHR